MTNYFLSDNFEYIDVSYASCCAFCWRRVEAVCHLVKVLLIVPFLVLMDPGCVTGPPLGSGVESRVAGDGRSGAQAGLLHPQSHHSVQVHGHRTVGFQQPIRSHRIGQACQSQHSGQVRSVRQTFNVRVRSEGGAEASRDSDCPPVSQQSLAYLDSRYGAFSISK